MSDFALAPQSGLLSYIVGSLTAPRVKVRQLMAEPELKSVGWKLVFIAAVVSVTAGILSGLYQLSYDPTGFETTFLPADYPRIDIFLWAAIEFGLFVLSFFLALFLWLYLFRYRDQADGVWAAAVMSCCLAVMLDPLVEVATLVQGTDAGTTSLAATLGVYAVIASLMIAAYFSAALAIPYWKAFALSFCVTVIDVIVAAVIILAIMMPSLLWASNS